MKKITSVFIYNAIIMILGVFTIISSIYFDISIRYQIYDVVMLFIGGIGVGNAILLRSKIVGIISIVMIIYGVVKIW